MDMNATMSPYHGSGANSPAIGGGNGQFSHPSIGASMTAPASPSGAYSASALAYANAQLSQYATGAAIPPYLNPHALSSALSDYSLSLPNSAASSPGATPRRLPGTGASTPGGNSRVAASAITGKRLNWSEMICQTIAESESGRLVIQDLFTGMCAKFPEIREWAFGKDWEGRVKNRIKSTLSIKGNLFVKVPRPSTAAGKGSWWTLSAEAQEAWKTGRVANVVKNNGHSRAGSAGPSSIHGSPVRTVSSKTGGTSHTPNPPYLMQSSHSLQNHSQRTSPLGLGLGANQFGSPLANNFGFNDSLGMTSNPTAPSNLSNVGGNDGAMQQGVSNQAMMDQAQNAQNMNSHFAHLGFMQPNAPQPLGNAQSMPHLGGPQSMPFPAQGLLNSDDLANFGNFDGADYSALFASLPGYDANNFNAAPNATNNQMAMALAAYNLEPSSHPFGGSMPGAYTLLQNQQQQQAGQNNGAAAAYNAYNMFPQQQSQQQPPQQNQQQPQQQQHTPQSQPTPAQRPQQTPQQRQQQQPQQQQRLSQQPGSTPGPQAIPQQQQHSNNGSVSSSLGTSYPGSSPFGGMSANGMEGPSPADSTWFSFTPLVQATPDSSDANGSSSALGTLGGEGSRKRRTSEGLTDFQLPPPESGS